MRWRRSPREGMSGPEIHRLCRGDEKLATVQAHRSCTGYFWYGGGKNTAGDPPLSLDDAKAAALAHIKGKP